MKKILTILALALAAASLVLIAPSAASASPTCPTGPTCSSVPPASEPTPPPTCSPTSPPSPTCTSPSSTMSVVERKCAIIPYIAKYARPHPRKAHKVTKVTRGSTPVPCRSVKVGHPGR